MDKYKSFFEEIKRFKKKQHEQKQRGLNDYNLLTSVLDPYDEVRLHSRMLSSFLDPQGTHYQGALFLELFLKSIDFKGFKYKNAQVFREYRHIDLYLTDGNKHIIIENKLNAGDQEEQIERYLKAIRDENKESTANDFLVIYLSIDRERPSEYSLGGLEIKSDKYLVDGNKEISLYKSIHYKKEILEWLDRCRYEVQNITNLNASLSQYADVVRSICNLYEDKVMKLQDYLLDHKNDTTNEVIEEILQTFQDPSAIITGFFSFFKLEMTEKIKNECRLDDTWSIGIDLKNIGQKWWRPITIGRKDWFDQESYPYVSYCLEVTNSKMNESCFGLVVSDKMNLTEIGDFSALKKEAVRYNFVSDSWWLIRINQSYSDLSSVKSLIQFLLNKKEATETLAQEIIDVINYTNKEGLVDKINEDIRKT